MILAVNHVQFSIPVGSEDEARAFYCGVLGLQEVPKPETAKARGGFWLQLGDLQIHAGAEDGVDRAATRSHVAYEVQDLEAMRALLEKNGIKTQEAFLIPGMIRCECRDPFGNRMEFLQKLPA